MASAFGDFVQTAVPTVVNPEPTAVKSKANDVRPDSAAVNPVPATAHPVRALYVGDLLPAVTESLLLEKFSSVGQVHSVRLCKARRPGTSHKYAFVNFQHEKDAEHALDLLSYDLLLDQPMRIMWSNRNPSLRNSNTGNIFVKGLEKSIDSLALYDIFSEFGHVLSCKVVCDEHGSRGYGYVHFENAEDTETAIKKLNGTLFKDHKLFITHFESRQKRQAAKRMTAKGDSKQVHVSQVLKKEKEHPKINKQIEEAQNPRVRLQTTDIVPAVGLPEATTAGSPVSDVLNPTSALYVGDLHPDVTESLLMEKFSSVGQVHSIRICEAKRTGVSNKHAFINFQHQKDAECALDLLNYDILLGQPMRIMWSSRSPSLKSNRKGNIFIKGLEKSIDSLELYKIFSEFGNILSCKVVCDENGSRGYGYVHFESADVAKMAIKQLNGTLFKDHKVFITHFKSRQERHASNKVAAKEDNKNQILPHSIPQNKENRKDLKNLSKPAL